ncbi:MAG: hypothetical protein GXP45_00765 [bacterium]|nr:hypothetical protein [bacterium]
MADIQNIKPNLDAVKILTRETCEKIQVLVFDQKDKKLNILTTNNFSEELKKLLKLLSDK